jgi:hypothetical protein
MANRLWLLKSRRAWKAFRKASGDPRKAQERLLESYLEKNAPTEYGRKHGFGELGTVTDYQARVPMVAYDNLAEEIRRIREGKPNVLSADPVLLLQPSSGSTTAAKLIPFTGTLKREFDRGVAVWITDLFRSRPELMGGPAYWSVSPAVGREEEAGGSRSGESLGAGVAPSQGGPGAPGKGPSDPVRDEAAPPLLPIGFEEDAAYLGGGVRRLVRKVLAVPEEMGRVTDTGTHRYLTLLHLLGCPELRILSVWSPTFLSLLLEPLEEWWEDLLEELAGGKLHPPGRGGGARVQGQAATTHPPIPAPKNPARARELRQVDPRDYRAIWPRLGLLSTWADGTSGPYAEGLSRSFPGVPLQPKGLIATEAFMTLPLWGVDGAVPAITSHFLEFLPEGNPEDRPKLVDELDRGARYEIVVTTGGGLYRYRMGDVLEVVGRVGNLPCLRFVGRADKVSDLFGEKLSDGFVARVFQTLGRRHELTPAFSLLAPHAPEESQPRYIWFLNAPGVAESAPLRATLESELDYALSESFHYRTCRKLGQLAPLEVCFVDDRAPQRYLLERRRRGQELGEIKIPALETGRGWTAVLVGEGAAGQSS